MALIVEDGTGLADAESFISLAAADAYHAARGNTGWTGTDAAKEAALRRASAILSASYDWAGTRLRGRTQGLAWPRVGVFDAERYAVPQDAVPSEVAHATAEVALRELVSPGSMTPDVTTGGQVKRERVGPIEVEYAGTLTADAMRPVLFIVRDLIGGLLRYGPSGAYSARAVRG